jgi:hypothetical protein
MIYISPPIVTNGLILHYDAASNPRCYSGSGTTVKNLVSSSYTGTLTSGVGYTTLNAGRFTFDGVDDYISTGASPLSTAAASVGVWFRADAQTSGANSTLRPLFMQGDFNSNQTVAAAISITMYRTGATGTGKLRFTWGNDLPQYSVETSSRYDEGEFHYACIVNDGTNFKAYVDGVYIGTAPRFTGVSTSPVLQIGGSTTNVDRKFKGHISIVQIYNRELSATEVLQNFNAHKGRYNLFN